MRVSFVVPVYNVKPYLDKCIESLLYQDYDDFEIVIVDDGSTDGSGELADVWALSSDKIVVSHQQNQGLSAARNRGVDIARGDYIAFVDSDDYWCDNVLRGLIEQIELQNLDILRFRYQNVREDGSIFSPNKAKDGNDYSSTPTDGKSFLDLRMGLQCYACQFLVRRPICKKELFKEGIYFEDVDWLPRVMFVAGRVASTKQMVYNYLWREGSITLDSNSTKKRKRVKDKLIIVENLMSIGYGRVWINNMITAVVISIVSEISGESFSYRVKYLRELNRIGVRPLSDQKIYGKARKKVRLINISPILAVILFRINGYFNRT